MSDYWGRQRPTAVGTRGRLHAGGSPTARADSIVIGRFQGTVVVTLHGALDASLSAGLGSVLQDLIDGQGNLAIVVDLRDVDRADCSGVHVLGAAADRIEARGGQLRLSGPVSGVFDALALSGLTRLVDAGFEEERRPRSLERPGRSDVRQRSMSSHPAGTAHWE